MPLLIALALATAGFVWWAWGRNRAGAEVSRRLDHAFRKRPPCRWQATGDARETLREWRCDTCRTTAYGRAGAPPRECKRHLGGGL